MPHPPGKKDEGFARILASAARGFRRMGYGGLGVDVLARDAGVTSGAFYAHFKSKASAFRDAVVAGLSQLKSRIEGLQETDGPAWRKTFVEFYLTVRRRCDIGETCAVQSLTAEVERADAETRAAYTAELRGVLAALAQGMTAETDQDRRNEAIALISLLIGGVSLARAIDDAELGDEIMAAIHQAALPPR